MDLKFWKKKTPDGEDGGTPGFSGVLAWAKARVAALSGLFKAPSPFQAEVATPDDETTSPTGEAPAETSAATAEPLAARLKSRLTALFLRPSAETDEGEAAPTLRIGVIVGAIALLLALLAAFVFATWKIIQSSPDHGNDLSAVNGGQRASLPIIKPVSSVLATPSLAESAAAESITAASAVIAPDKPVIAPPEQPTSAVAIAPPAAKTYRTPEAEIEALKKEKAELQSQLDALRKAQQRPPLSVRVQPGGGAQPAAGGSVTISNGDAKAAAETLKTAIEAMNAGSSDYQKKPAK